ncbi:MAG: hypothetical protein FWG35_08365 [Spirochaetaceae bacterium]|nr:hypothetical protein [Spirochaetaceae bacterium]
MIFFTSGHPFSRYINSRWRRFPFIDTSGGNVTHAAVSLADSLGAREIHLYGADFSCPEGKSYAREAYAYPYFRCRETRLAGIESLFTHFLFRTTSTRAVWHGREVRYANASLAQYKERLESSSRGLRARLVPVPGKGETLRIAAPAGDKEPPAIFAASARRGSWKEFLAAYGAGIAKLPAPGSPIISYLRGLSPEERDIVTTLLPAAAVFVRAARKEKIPAPRLLYLARSWTREELEKTLVRG